MPVKIVSGNLLEADADALVNTVNTVGIMGKGIALQFKQAYPENFVAYQGACRRGEVRPGAMFIFETGALTVPRFIVNFPTKRDWRSKARMEDVESGLVALVADVKERKITSLALPPVGCGNGGLEWDRVRPRIEEVFDLLPDVSVLLFSPDGAPQADTMPVATIRPSMTPTRAALIGLLHRYAEPGYHTTLLEIQKLVYFLQVAGEPLDLAFRKAQFGPYAETLHHILQRIEGHFVRGYGDRSRSAQVLVLSEAEREADLFIEEHPNTRERMERVAELIEGFESPRGLELLATVHWVASEPPFVTPLSPDEAVRRVQAWSTRKREKFPPEQIKMALLRLKIQGWVS